MSFSIENFPTKFIVHGDTIMRHDGTEPIGVVTLAGIPNHRGNRLLMLRTPNGYPLRFEPKIDMRYRIIPRAELFECVGGCGLQFDYAVEGIVRGDVALCDGCYGSIGECEQHDVCEDTCVACAAHMEREDRANQRTTERFIRRPTGRVDWERAA